MLNLKKYLFLYSVDSFRVYNKEINDLYFEYCRKDYENNHSEDRYYFDSDGQDIKQNLNITLTDKQLQDILLKLTPGAFRDFYSNYVNYEINPNYNYMQKIETLRKQNFDKIISSCKNFDEVRNCFCKDFNFYTKNLNMYGNKEKNSSQKKVFVCKDIFAERFFGDTFHNLMTNIKSLKTFNRNFYHQIPTELKEKMFSLFATVKYINNNNDFNSIKETYLKTLNINKDFKSMLYDAITEAKYLFAQNFVNSCTKFDDLKPQNSVLGIKIFYPTKFKLFISSLETDRNKKNNKVIINELVNCEQKTLDLLSLSYVDNDHFHTFYSAKSKIHFAYYNIKPEEIIYATRYDNFCSYTETSKDKMLSRHPFDFHSPQNYLDYINSFGEYNEFNILKRKPDAIFSYKEPTLLEINIAKKFNLPIIVPKNLQRIADGGYYDNGKNHSDIYDNSF